MGSSANPNLDRDEYPHMKRRNSPGFTADDFNEACRIRDKVQAVRQEISRLEKEHAAAVKAQEGKLAALQKQCKHQLTKYYGDPAGGSDSTDECQICGKLT